MNVLICPFCSTPLRREGASLYCNAERPHCFDIAKSGYVTLTRAAGTSGDDREMVRARTAFLDSGHYLPFAEAVCEELAGCDTVIDAGCGEGYYSNIMAQKGHSVYGFDLSKHACDKAAKRAKVLGNRAFFGVSSVVNLPVADGSADAVVSLFAPIAEKEFLRVLKPGGFLIIGGAGQKHLLELKRAVYSTAYENEGRRDLPTEFIFSHKKNVSYTFTCEDLKSLFMMTPYAFKTSPADAAKLDVLERLDITADFDIFVYKKTV